MNDCKFTFHYGSILIVTRSIRVTVTIQFTFHYGSILIISAIKDISNTTGFTFHYGSILMLPRQPFEDIGHIYIPLWFYSNYFLIFFIFLANIFTFHYGSILMKLPLNHAKYEVNLHSTMVLF